MKGTEIFKKTISDHLQGLAAKDALFAETLKKENKSIDGCVTYILNTVQKSGCNGFAEDEIFGMAVHYYDEDDVKAGKPVNATVVVNHKVELSDSEKEKIKKEAIERAIEDERQKVKLEYKVELTDEEISEAKDRAIAKVVEEQREKMVKNKTEKPSPKKSDASKSDLEKEEQVFLFE